MINFGLVYNQKTIVALGKKFGFKITVLFVSFFYVELLLLTQIFSK